MIAVDHHARRLLQQLIRAGEPLHSYSSHGLQAFNLSIVESEFA